MKKILVLFLLVVATSAFAQKSDYHLQLSMSGSIPVWMTDLQYENIERADETVKKLLYSVYSNEISNEKFDVCRKNKKGATLLNSKNYFFWISNIDFLDNRKDRNKVFIFFHDKKNDIWKRGTVDFDGRIDWSIYSANI